MMPMSSIRRSPKTCNVSKYVAIYYWTLVLSLDDVITIVEQARSKNIACLFTLRHPSHGGKFAGDEQERVSINRQVLAAGVDIIDLEWRSEAATQLLAEDNIPLILSHHDFEKMPNEAELEDITQQMLSAKPTAIKLVPTAATLADSVRMLQWVDAADSTIQRIGFAMGEAGACSRILTIAFGAPITYASFGEPVAPGQVAIDDLLDIYRVMTLDQQTRVIAVAQHEMFRRESVISVNQQLQADAINGVAIPFGIAQLNSLKAQRHALRVDDILTE